MRGIAVVRRDNFPAAVEAQKKLLNFIMECPSTREILDKAAEIRRSVRMSLSHVHDALPPAGCFTLQDFVQTGSLSKPMQGPNAYSEKDVMTPALAVALRGGVHGLGSRIPWVLRSGSGGVAARAASPIELAADRCVSCVLL